MKFKKRINSADIVIVIAILAVVSGLIFRQPVEKMVSRLFFGTSITYSVQLYGAPSESFSEGTELFDANGDGIGTITNAVFSDATGISTSNGLITVETSGMRDETGTYIGNTFFIAPGLELEVHCADGTSAFGIVKKVETE